METLWQDIRYAARTLLKKPDHQPEQLARVETLDTKVGRTGGVAVGDLDDMRTQNN